MKPYNTLRQRRLDTAAEGKALAEKIEAMTASAEEQERAVAIVAELADLDKQIEQAEVLRAYQRSPEAEVVRMPAQVRTEPDKFASLGEYMLAVRNAAFGNVDARLIPLQAAVLGGNEAVGAEGGFLVQTALGEGLEKKLWNEGAFTARATPATIPAGANSVEYLGISEDSRANGSRYGGITGYRVAEAGTISPSGAQQFYKYTLKPKGYAALAYLTNQLMRDTAQAARELNDAVPAELSFMINDDMLRGTGANGCLGVLNASCLVTASKEDGQAADTVTYGNILEMWNRRWAPGSYTWFINQEVEQQLDQLYQAAGTAGIPPRFIDYGPDGVLRMKGCPVVVTEYNSAIGDVGDILLADWSQYRLARIGGVEAATSIHVAFTSAQMAYRWMTDADGQPIWKSALTPYKATASRTVSPFVTLEAR